MSKQTKLPLYENEFDFGDHLLLDGDAACQYIHPLNNGLHTVDVNGMWYNVSPDQLKIRKNYEI